MSQTKAELINAKGDAAFDTDTLFIDSVNNRVGVGTTSPGDQLALLSNTNSANGITVENTNTSSDARGQLQIKSDSVTGYLWAGSSTFVGTAGGGRASTLALTTSSTDTAGGIALLARNSSAPITFHTGGNTERARIDSSGRLLVGTSSSASTGDAQYARLQVQGNTAASTNGAILALMRQQAATAPLSAGDLLGKIDFTDSSGNTFGTIFCGADASTGSNDYPGRLVFSTTADGASSPTERMRINAEGLVGIITPGECLRYGTALGAGTTTPLFRARHSASAIYGGTTCFVVYTNGDTQNTNNSYGALSDIKLKENIVDASSQWDDIKALRPVNYNFKPETGAETYKQLGLIAQEVEQVCPGLVSESPDRDEEGNDLGTVTKSVNYSVLYMKAVKALQEAMERIEQLEAEMVAVKAQLS